MKSKNQTSVIILAAGQGKRMENKDLPKVLTHFEGMPLVRHVLDAVYASRISEKPVAVVGYRAEQVVAELGRQCEYAYQMEQLGTGHAVMSAESLLRGRGTQVLVLYGDMPLIMPETIRSLAKLQEKTGAVMAMATVMVEDYEDWRSGFTSFGRIVRDTNDRIAAIIEAKDATPEILRITECNPSFFCFDAEWLWMNLPSLRANNAQGEYYLTDLVVRAKSQGRDIATIRINPHEALGVNTLEELILATKLKRELAIISL